MNILCLEKCNYKDPAKPGGAPVCSFVEGDHYDVSEALAALMIDAGHAEVDEDSGWKEGDDNKPDDAESKADDAENKDEKADEGKGAENKDAGDAEENKSEEDKDKTSLGAKVTRALRGGDKKK